MKRTILQILLILAAALCLTAFQTADEPAPAVTLNPLTGTPVANPELRKLPPVFVPLARYPSAFRPSSGHSQAQWVFEMYVSDEESRPVLMYWGELPSVPVSRISSAFFGLENLRRQFGGVIIAGGTSKSILESDIRNLELWYGTTGDQLYPELPVTEYQRILNNRDKILAEARKKAQETEEKAQAYADHLVSETQITKMAQERAQEILNNAGEQAQQMLDSARDEAEAIRESALSYTYDKLVSIQSILNGTIDDTQNRFSSLLSSLNEHQRIVESNLQELNGTVPPEADITDHAGEYFDADRIPSFDDEEEDD